MLRHDIHLRLEILVVRAKVFGGQYLVGEAHVHYRSGMSLGGRQINKTSFCEQVNFAAIPQLIFVHERAHFALAAGHLFQRGDVNLHVEVAGVANNRPALHLFEMLAADHALVSRHGNVNVALLHRFSHGHNSEPVHYSFDALYRVDFRNDDVRAEALGAHGHAAPAPAVTGNDYLQASKQNVRRANNTVNRGLPGTVAIVKEVFGHRIIHGNDRILERPVLGHCAKTDHPGSGLLRSGNHVWDELGTLGQQHGDQVRAVVHGELRLVLQRRAQVRIVGVVILAFDGQSRNVVVAIQRSGDLVLRG